MSKEAAKSRNLPQHGVKGAYHGGTWVDLEDCADTFLPDPSACSQCPNRSICPRSQSRNAAVNNVEGKEAIYDIVIIGAGCIGSAIARELSRYELSTLLVESADDVSQGATKGNSGIVHAGYDDKPGSVRAKFCWSGNQMFPKLDRELRFGYQKNGSLVVATNHKEVEVLNDLMERGRINGVENLRIVKKDELFEMEPALNPECIAALYAPDAGNVIPYEFTIALAENAVDNGVELRIRKEVTSISKKDKLFEIDMRHWEPREYVDARKKMGKAIDGTESKEISLVALVMRLCISFPASIVVMEGLIRFGFLAPTSKDDVKLVMTIVAFISTALVLFLPGGKQQRRSGGTGVLKDIVGKCPPPVGSGEDGKVALKDMFQGGSGSKSVLNGVTVGLETVKAKYVINCAGSYSDQIARMIGDDSFYIKPRLGDYILLNRNQGYLTHSTIFPCPDPVLGKGVLVQTTLWGNTILGPTARDMHDEGMKNMSNESIQEYILSKCKKLCPYFDPKEAIQYVYLMEINVVVDFCICSISNQTTHLSICSGFCGARSKSSRGDWIIEPSSKDANFIHVAGIDSPGLAGSPAIAKYVVEELLQKAGLKMPPNRNFNPNRAPIITPKVGLRGLKMGPVGKNDSDGKDEAVMAKNVVCKCEKVTELEVVRALRRSLPIDSTQGIRKRTRAGMGHCQGDPDNYCCESRVRAIISRENGVSVDEVGGRPWPATSTFLQRWIYKDDAQKEGLEQRMNN